MPGAFKLGYQYKGEMLEREQKRPNGMHLVEFVCTVPRLILPHSKFKRLLETKSILAFCDISAIE